MSRFPDFGIFHPFHILKLQRLGFFCCFVLGTESRAPPTSDKYTDHQVSPQPTAPLLSQLNFFFSISFFGTVGVSFGGRILIALQLRLALCMLTKSSTIEYIPKRWLKG